jgi:hypothetical protein
LKSVGCQRDQLSRAQPLSGLLLTLVKSLDFERKFYPNSFGDDAHGEKEADEVMFSEKGSAMKDSRIMEPISTTSPERSVRYEMVQM